MLKKTKGQAVSLATNAGEHGDATADGAAEEPGHAAGGRIKGATLKQAVELVDSNDIHMRSKKNRNDKEWREQKQYAGRIIKMMTIAPPPPYDTMINMSGKYNNTPRPTCATNVKMVCTLPKTRTMRLVVTPAGACCIQRQHPVQR